MTRARVLAVLAVIVLWPTPAHAARGFWAWLEELSGPGFFDGPMYAMPVKCWHDGAAVPCRYLKGHDVGVQRNDNINRTFELSGGVLRSGDRRRFKDRDAIALDADKNNRNVTVVPINGALRFRPYPWLDVGPGIGVLMFFGESVEAKPRIVLLGNATWKPGLSTSALRSRTGALGRMFGVELQASYITKGFTAADFGSTSSSYTPRRELRGSIGFSLDLRER
jgi:hypothetical protein